MYSTESRQLNRAARSSPRGAYFFSPCIARANPPFKGSLDYDIVSTDLLQMARSDLFLQMEHSPPRVAARVRSERRSSRMTLSKASSLCLRSSSIV